MRTRRKEEEKRWGRGRKEEERKEGDRKEGGRNNRK
jgi:hypothetical protein